MTEVLSLSEFEAVIRRHARFDASAPPPDALAAVVQTIQHNPALAPSRLLGRLLHALSENRGAFRRADASMFDAPTIRLAVALMDAASARTHTRAEWAQAIAAADAKIGS